MISLQKSGRRVAIVGNATATRGFAPFDDPSWEIWGLAWCPLKRADRLFEMHHPGMWSDYAGPDYPAQLAASQTPIVMRERHEAIPASVAFPFERVDADLNGGMDSAQRPDIYSSSINYMIAMAIAEGYGEIFLPGVEQLVGGPYTEQLPATEYLIGLARGRGIIVTQVPGSTLCKRNFAYGAAPGEGGQQAAIGITEDILRARISKYEQDRQATEARMNAEINRMNTLDGALAEARQLLDFVIHFNNGGAIPTNPPAGK